MKKEIPLSVRKGNAPVMERLAVLNKTQGHAVLATTANDKPHTSLVAFALVPDMDGIIFATPRDTLKYRNILTNRHVSLLIDSRTNTDTDYLFAEAITVTGTAHPVRRGRLREELAKVLRSKHPALSAFIDSEKTAIVIVRVRDYMHVGTFQTVTHHRSGRALIARKRIRESR